MPGLYEFCMSGHHEECSDKDCRCLCHPWAQKLAQQFPSQQRPVSSLNNNLVCPVCDHKPRAGDVFCRVGGERLIAGKTCHCGKAGEPDDLYCGGCGQRFGNPAVPVPTLSEEEIAALEAQARQRPSDVEVPPQEIH